MERLGRLIDPPIFYLTTLAAIATAVGFPEYAVFIDLSNLNASNPGTWWPALKPIGWLAVLAYVALGVARIWNGGAPFRILSTKVTLRFEVADGSRVVVERDTRLVAAQRGLSAYRMVLQPDPATGSIPYREMRWMLSDHQGNHVAQANSGKETKAMFAAGKGWEVFVGPPNDGVFKYSNLLLFLPTRQRWNRMGYRLEGTSTYLNSFMAQNFDFFEIDARNRRVEDATIEVHFPRDRKPRLVRGNRIRNMTVSQVKARITNDGVATLQFKGLQDERLRLSWMFEQPNEPGAVRDDPQHVSR